MNRLHIGKPPARWERGEHHAALVIKPDAVCLCGHPEARVLAWLAGEKWVSEVFEKGGDIYCETAHGII